MIMRPKEYAEFLNLRKRVVEQRLEINRLNRRIGELIAECERLRTLAGEDGTEDMGTRGGYDGGPEGED